MSDPVEQLLFFAANSSSEMMPRLAEIVELDEPVADLEGERVPWGAPRGAARGAASARRRRASGWPGRLPRMRRAERGRVVLVVTLSGSPRASDARMWLLRLHVGRDGLAAAATHDLVDLRVDDSLDHRRLAHVLEGQRVVLTLHVDDETSPVPSTRSTSVWRMFTSVMRCSRSCTVSRPMIPWRTRIRVEVSATS